MLQALLRRNWNNWQTKGASIVMPFTTQNEVEMRHAVAVPVTGHAVEADVGDVVLTAAIEAAADFDVQIMHRRIVSDLLCR